MRLAIVADTFPPLRTSGAVQLRDLAREMVEQGHDVTVFTPQGGEGSGSPFTETKTEGYTVIRIRSPKTKDVNYVRRTINEFLMPFAMRKSMANHSALLSSFEGVVWYSPSIFLAPFVQFVRSKSRCPSYLILRDIFPEWAADMGVIGRGLPFYFFKAVARYQYSVASIIGVQAHANLSFFSKQSQMSKSKIEVLQNWLRPPVKRPCSINLSHTPLAGRKIFVYAGNMGVAQGVDLMLELADRLRNRDDVGFAFVGRGSHVESLKDAARTRSLSNVLFFHEIDPDEISGLYDQCHVGLVTLDIRHVTHNIPGKFISYMHCGVPVLAAINPGNDLQHLIEHHRVGRVLTTSNAADLIEHANSLLQELETESDIRSRCLQLAQEMFSASTAVRQIISSLNAGGDPDVTS